MAEFNRDKLEEFLGIVRKYMQVRGPMSQKELAELAETGVSTMSRFLTMKTTELNPQLIAKIVACLNIPLHEMIDFVDEEYADKFIRLVKFYKDDIEDDESSEEVFTDDVDARIGGDDEKTTPKGGFEEAEIARAMSANGGSKKTGSGSIKIGGKRRSLPFRSEQKESHADMSLKEKLESLSPRQKAYMTDFLNLDMEGRDLIVDIGNNLFRYFKHKGFDF